MENKSHAQSYFRTRRASSLITAIIPIPHPNPFRDSLRSSQFLKLFDIEIVGDIPEMDKTRVGLGINGVEKGEDVMCTLKRRE